MSVSQQAAYAYSLYKNVKKIRKYGKLVTEAVDEDTRAGALLTLGIDGMMAIASKALGTSLTKHPYFAFHKVHLEALVQALNASSNFDGAQAALGRAIGSADAAEALAQALQDYRVRRKALNVAYKFQIAGALLVLHDRGGDQMIRESGQTHAGMQATTDQNIYEWRALWSELYLESVQLMAMAQVELRATEAAMKNFDAKMKALSTGGNIGGLFAAQVKENREWQWYDRATKPGSGSEKAVLDPVGSAQKQVDAIQDLSDDLADECEWALSDDAYRPEVMQHHMGVSRTFLPDWEIGECPDPAWKQRADQPAAYGD